MGKITRFHRNFQLNIGLIVGLILLIYALFHLLSYLTGKHISVYEVGQGTLSTTEHYNALAVRSEQIVNADTSGELYFYKANNAEAGAKSLIYSVDEKGDINKLLNDSSEDVSELADDDVSRMTSSLSGYVNGYNDSDFHSTYTFTAQLNSELADAYNARAINSYADEIATAQSNNTFHLNYAPVPGLIVYQTDGLEGVTTENFTSESLDPASSSVTDLRKKSTVAAGDPVYKIITSDDWNLIAEISSDMAEKLKDISVLQVTFDKDHISTWAAVNLEEKSNRHYLILGFTDSMERYADLRYMSISIELDHASGLKIPNSAITSKKFFTIPKTYFYKGGDSNDVGVMIQGKSGNSFVVPTIYYESEDYYYCDSEDLKGGTLLIRPNSTETYTVGTTTEKLKGVYCVNKGYAVFKQINILYQNSSYTIVDTNTSYGLALYDRIALDGSSVKENEIVH